MKMQVREISRKGLKHEFVITIPAIDVEKEVEARLAEIGKTAKLKGFRPGKIPPLILKQRFGENARGEALEKVISKSIRAVLEEQKLEPVLKPQIELISADEGRDIEFKTKVEVFPVIDSLNFSELNFERPATKVTDTMIEETVARLARTLRKPSLVEESRTAKKGDVVVIDFEGFVEGKQHPGMKGKNHMLELGSQSFVGNFEEQLIGTIPGEERKVEIKFPEDYHATYLAGKSAVFEVKIKELREYGNITIDDELAKEAGFDNLSEMRRRILEDLVQRYDSISRSLLKRRLMDKLAERYKFPVPEGMLEAEFNAIWQQVLKEKQAGKLSESEAKKTEEELKKEYQEIAERRVRLGLLLAEVAKRGKIEVTPEDLRKTVIAKARQFPGQEKAVIDYYLKTEGAIESLRAPTLEEKAVDYILSQAKIKDKLMSADDLVKLSEELE